MKVRLPAASVFCALITVAIQAAPQLQLLQIVFAHKTYAPISDLINSNDTDLPSSLTYEHFTSGPLKMPTSGMLHMYDLGVHLRDKYDQFLGDVFTIETMKMQTAAYPLSMMSGQLVNAGLWPPAENQKWNSDMNWQPIPTDYVSMHKDTLLLGMHCPSFVTEMREVLNADRMRERMLHHSALFNHVSRYTGMKIRQPSEIALLYSVLETKRSIMDHQTSNISIEQSTVDVLLAKLIILSQGDVLFHQKFIPCLDLNQSLPYWAKDIFPDGGMYNVSLLAYDLLSQTPLQKQLNGGTILKEILSNSLAYIHGGMPKERKLMMYSGNDRNIAGTLKSLDLWSPHIPNEAASLIFEMYFDNETNSRGMKINYYTGVEGVTIPLKLPNCTEICPMERFLNIVFDVIPQNEDLVCHWKKIELPEGNDVIISNSTMYNRSVSYKLESIIISCLLVVSLSGYSGSMFDLI